MESGFNGSVRKDQTKFSIGQFMKLIKTTQPKYLLLAMGVLLLVVSSGVQIYVPKLASSLVNHFSKGIDYGLLGKVVALFVISAIVSAIGGTVLGIFGENVIQNLRKRAFCDVNNFSFNANRTPPEI